MAKHQSGKAADAARATGDQLADEGRELLNDTREAARELVDKAPEYLDKGKSALEDLSDKIWQEAEAAADKAKAMKDEASAALNHQLSKKESPQTPADPSPGALFGKDFELDLIESEPPTPPGEGKIDDIRAKAGDWLDATREKAGKTLEDLNEKATPTLDAAAKAGLAAKDKLADLSERTGKEVLEKGDALLNRAAEAGASAKGHFDRFVDHANAEAEKMKLEENIEAAKDAAAQAAARARAFGDKEAQRDTSDSTLSGTDSFFDRAAKYADGDYHNGQPGEVRITDNPEASAKPAGGLLANFQDNDQDGDSLIDDAIIEEE